MASSPLLGQALADVLAGLPGLEHLGLDAFGLPSPPPHLRQALSPPSLPRLSSLSLSLRNHPADPRDPDCSAWVSGLSGLTHLELRLGRPVAVAVVATAATAAAEIAAEGHADAPADSGAESAAAGSVGADAGAGANSSCSGADRGNGGTRSGYDWSRGRGPAAGSWPPCVVVGGWPVVVGTAVTAPEGWVAAWAAAATLPKLRVLSLDGLVALEPLRPAQLDAAEGPGPHIRHITQAAAASSTAAIVLRSAPELRSLSVAGPIEEAVLLAAVAAAAPGLRAVRLEGGVGVVRSGGAVRRVVEMDAADGGGGGGDGAVHAVDAAWASRVPCVAVEVCGGEVVAGRLRRAFPALREVQCPPTLPAGMGADGGDCEAFGPR